MLCFSIHQAIFYIFPKLLRRIRWKKPRNYQNTLTWRRIRKLLIKWELIFIGYESQVKNFTFPRDIYLSRSSRLFPQCLLSGIDFQYLIIAIIETNWSQQNSRSSDSVTEGWERSKATSSYPKVRGTDECLPWRGNISSPTFSLSRSWSWLQRTET